MKIVATTQTNTARYTTEKAVFNIDYTTTNGKLDRIQFNIFKPEQDDGNPAYLGSIHYDSRNVSCNIPWSEDIQHYFEVAAGFIADIIESTTGDERPSADNGETINDKSR